jgi:hypothetical protein
MKNYKKLRLICEKNTLISARVIDEFLIYYASERDHLDFQMNRRFEIYKHITDTFPEELINKLKAQYIAHRIFREDGLIKDYLYHTAVINLGVKNRKWLEIQSKEVWRFCFSVIKDCPAENFFIMKDVFSDVEYLLYSPSVSKILAEQSIALWFNLLSFNGHCWQSYGPIVAYSSFEPSDIFFFGGEVNEEIVTVEEFLDDLEYNPVPYMMLVYGANSPLIINKNDRLVHVLAEYYPESFNIKEISVKFRTEYRNGVYRLSLKTWSDPPHWAHVYYDESHKILRFTSMTERGYRAFLKAVNKSGYDFKEDIIIRVNLSMIKLTSNILKKEIDINEYEELFSEKSSVDENEILDKLNTFIRLVIPEINAGNKPDIRKLAGKTGIDIDTAKSIVKEITKRFNSMNGIEGRN